MWTWSESQMLELNLTGNQLFHTINIFKNNLKARNNWQNDFKAAVKGFHIYKTASKPSEIEPLTLYHDEDNPYNMFSIKVCKFDVRSVFRTKSNIYDVAFLQR